MTSEQITEKSEYDYIIKGKEPPKEVVEVTLLRDNNRQKLRQVLDSVKGKTPHEQYLALQQNGFPIPNWPEDNEPSGIVYGGMEGGKPARVD